MHIHSICPFLKALQCREWVSKLVVSSARERRVKSSKQIKVLSTSKTPKNHPLQFFSFFYSEYRHSTIFQHLFLLEIDRSKKKVNSLFNLLQSFHCNFASEIQTSFFLSFFLRERKSKGYLSSLNPA